VKASRYVRKPFYVDAVQVTKENMAEVEEWCRGTQQVDLDGNEFIKVLQHRSKMVPKTRAFVGDWVLSSRIGFRVYTNSAFEKAFEYISDVSEGDWTDLLAEALKKTGVLGGE
jgi:hypothetical protein